MSKDIESMIRVNHAGEYGAKRIYEGQLAFIQDRRAKKLITEMHKQELEHLEYFEGQMRERRVRPTAFFPLWHMAGYALGAATALMGKSTAMMCTEAVEEVIAKHYQSQLDVLEEGDLKTHIEEFMHDELEHGDIAKAHEAGLSPMYAVLSGAIKLGCRAAIHISKRI